MSSLLSTPQRKTSSPDVLPDGTTATSFFVLAAFGAAQSIQEIPYVGDYFYVTILSGNGFLNVQPDNDSISQFQAGQGNHPPQGQFRSLQISNPNAFPISGVIVIGTDHQKGFLDKRLILTSGGQAVPLVVSPEGDTPIGSGLTTIAAGATVDFPGTAGVGIRKQISIINLDAGANLLVQDGSAILFHTILPGTAWTYASSGHFKLKNATAAGIAISAGETYFNQ